MPLIFAPPRSITGGAFDVLRRSGRLLPTGRTGFTLPGGRLPNADGNLPPDTVGRGTPSIDTPPGTDEGSTGAPEEGAVAGTGFSPLLWVRMNLDKVAIAAVAAVAVYAVYKHSKKPKSNRRRRNRRGRR